MAEGGKEEAIMPLAKTTKGLGVVAAMPQNGGKEVNIHFDQIKIEAVDAGSFIELTTRNPEAIILPFKTALVEGDTSLTSLIKETV